MILKYLNNKDPWMLAEDIPDMDFFISQIWQSCFTNEFKNPSGRAYKKVLTLHRGFHLWFYFGERDSFEVGENIVQKFIKKPSFAREINNQIVKEADKLRRFAEKLPEDEFKKLSNRELWKLYSKHDAVHTRYYRWCGIPVAADMFHNNLTNKLKEHLGSLKIPEEKINEYFTVLTQPTKKSLIQLEQEEFLAIAARMQANKGKVKPAIYQAICQHYLKNFYVKYLWIGKDSVNSFDFYLKELIKFIDQGNNAKKILAEKRSEQQKALKQRQALIKKLGLRGGWLGLFNAFGDFMVTKIYRRYAQIYAVYRMAPILREIAKRLKVSDKQVRFMMGKEVKAALLGEKINRNVLTERTRFCVYYTEAGQETVFIGKKAKKLAKQTKRAVNTKVNELHGQTGCLGKARGTVKIVIRPADMAKMKQGDVLVSIATDPDIVPAMKKAAAIVTEQGGVTSHAAIVSRELNIPCVIGTKIATKVLKDGDMVEVDANKGIVRKI